MILFNHNYYPTTGRGKEAAGNHTHYKRKWQFIYYCLLISRRQLLINIIFFDISNCLIQSNYSFIGFSIGVLYLYSRATLSHNLKY